MTSVHNVTDEMVECKTAHKAEHQESIMREYGFEELRYLNVARLIRNLGWSFV